MQYAAVLVLVVAFGSMVMTLGMEMWLDHRVQLVQQQPKLVPFLVRGVEDLGTP